MSGNLSTFRLGRMKYFAGDSGLETNFSFPVRHAKRANPLSSFDRHASEIMKTDFNERAEKFGSEENPSKY